MNTVTTLAIGVCLTDEQALELEAFAQACGTEVEFVRLLVDEGLLQPTIDQPRWRFSGEAIAQVRRIRRLQRDFDANLQCVAVMLDLMHQVERLQARLRRAGLDVHGASP